MAATAGFTNVQRLVDGMDAWTWLGFATGVATATEVERKAKGGAVPLDLRSPEEFAFGHIPGAVNVPAADVIKHPEDSVASIRKKFPDAKAVTLYLEGGEQADLYRAAFALEGKVRLAIFLFPAGFSAWQAEGKPVHSTE